MDIHFISAEAKTLHSFFVSIFYMLSTILLLIGVLLEYFKMPVGGSLSFPQLVGRTFIAAILLAAYPEISNMVAAVADAVADKIGDLNSFHHLLESAGAALKEHSWSWTSGRWRLPWSMSTGCDGASRCWLISVRPSNWAAGRALLRSDWFRRRKTRPDV